MNPATLRRAASVAAQRPTRSRVALAATLSVAAFTMGVTPASAESAPAGGCPPPYTLIAIANIPAPGQPGAFTLDERGNNDGYVCLMAFPNQEHPGAPFNGIDNRVQAP